MDQEKRVADYFVVAGLPDNPSPLDDVYSRDASSPAGFSHVGHAPITDIAVIFRSMGETVPSGYISIETTPFGFPADLNHGSLRSPNVYLCYKRGYDKPPIVDIGVLYEGKDRLLSDSEIVHTTPFGRPANVNNSGARTYITYRRYHETGPCNMLVVTDICLILANKGETAPHAFCGIAKNLNKGMLGSDVFLCYKKSMHRPELLCFKPEILGRFPMEDYTNFPLPDSVPLFCLPMGATLEAWPKKARQQKPVFSTFVLTMSDAVEKVYGAAMTFYENYPENKLSDEQRCELGLSTPNNTHTVHGNKSICILSHWPFFDTFAKFLRYLHTMSVSGQHYLPLERYISHFMLNVPFPSPQRPRILIQLASDRISLMQPEDSPLTLSGASFKELLRNLGPENCMMVMLFALLEQKLLIHSLRPDVLTSVAEAVAMLIFPFHWQCPYIPLCPLGLSDVLNAPLPFIVGVDSRYFDIYEPPYDVTCVDLDTNTISICEEKRPINLKLFPKKAARTLRNTLQLIFDRTLNMPTNSKDIENILQDEIPIDQDFKLKKEERALELEIQEAFLRFMSSILKGYKSYLLPITKRPTVRTTDASSLFDLQGFLKSRDRAYHRFYAYLMKTQMFTRFIEERSFVSNNDAGLAFFDECTEKMDMSVEGTETRLLESDDSHQSDRTVFLTPPEPIGLPSGVIYKYKEFGSLHPELFLQSVPSKIIANERICKQTSAFTPGSPLARRTKQEIRSALKAAKRQSETPMLWAKCVLSYCYSLWFIHLPSYVSLCSSKYRALNIAYEVLNKMQSSRLHPADEVCYRVLMQLCGQYSQPVLAVKVLFEMKRHGVQPNAITYGFYNKAVLESEWPSASTSASLLWKKLRNVVLGVARFKMGARITRSKRSFSLNSDLDFDRTSRASSHSNLEDATPVRNQSNTEVVQDLIKVDDPIVKDDHSSTGGQSDIGYCSMNQEETKKSTLSISSQSSQLGSSTTISNQNAPPSILKAKNRISGVSSSTVNHIIRFADFRASDEFRSRVGSIVRKSAGSIVGMNTLHDNTFDSSAGILHTTRLNFNDDCVFSDNKNTAILSPNNIKRKRHKSDSEMSHNFMKEKVVELRSRHCSGSGSAVHDVPMTALFCDQVCENDCGKDIQLCSENFGCDANIINRISGVQSTCNGNSVAHSNKLNSKSAKNVDQEVSDFLGSGLNENYSNAPKILPRPKSPNIPIKKKSTICSLDNDPLSSFSLGSEQSETTDKSFSSPAKDSWFNLDILNSLPRMTSSLSSSLGLNGNGNTNQLLNSLSTSLSSKCAKVARSATFSEDVGPLNSSNRMLRSSTLPSCESPSPEMIADEVDDETTPSGNWLTPIKNNFRRTESFRIKQGLNSLRSRASSAANSVASKLTEIKQSISTSNTPVKDTQNRTLYELDRISNRSRSILEEDSCRSSSDRVRLSVDYSYLSSRNPSMCSVNSEDQCNGLEDTTLATRLFSMPGSNESSRPGSLHQVESVSMFHSLYQTVTPDPQTDNSSIQGQNALIAMEIVMTSCSKCHVCGSLLYDEEIMAGWSADESNLNTQCQFCKMKVVPVLTVTLKDYRFQTDNNEVKFQETDGNKMCTEKANRKSPRKLKNILSEDGDCEQFILFEDSPESTHGTCSNSSSIIGSPEKSSTYVNSNESNRPIDRHNRVADSNQGGGIADNNTSPTSVLSHEPISVPYLSPLVLRKEFENILELEGDLCLTKSQFVDEHPIIYWNLIWFFWRIGVPSHLSGLCLNAVQINKGRLIPVAWANANSRNIIVHCRWNHPTLHEDVGPMMYQVWTDNPTESSLVHALVTERQTIAKSLMNQILTSVQCNDLLFPIRMLITERHRQSSQKERSRRHSMYRDLLFLSFVVLGRDNIDTVAFDKEYRRAFEKLTSKEIGMLKKNDRPPTLGSIFCRKYFRELQLTCE